VVESSKKLMRSSKLRGRCAMCSFATKLSVCPDCGEALIDTVDPSLLRNLSAADAATLIKWFRLFLVAVFLPAGSLAWVLLALMLADVVGLSRILFILLAKVPCLIMLGSWSWFAFKLANLGATKSLAVSGAVRFTSALASLTLTSSFLAYLFAFGSSIASFLAEFALLPVALAIWTLTTFIAALWERTAGASYIAGRRRPAPRRLRWFSAFFKLLSIVIFIGAGIKLIPYLAADPTAEKMRTCANICLFMSIIAAPILCLTVYEHVYAELTTNRPKPHNPADMQSGGSDGLHKDGVA
jgi:hypothetical protein